MKSPIAQARWTSRISLPLVLVLGVSALVLFERRTLAWMAIQEEYRAFDATFRAGARDKPLVYAVASTGDRKEYCVTCHLGMAGYKPREGTVFGSHPDVYHEVIEFDCVVCHKGDPDSLAECTESRYGIDRPFKGRFAWTSCLQCHDPGGRPESLERYDGASRAKTDIETTVKTFGCLGCHQIADRGGVIGPSLAQLGREKMSDVTGQYSTVYERIEDKVRNFRASSPNSIMPVTGISRVSSGLIASYLSLNGVTPRSPERWDIGRTLETQPQAQSGKEIYGYFCSGCHNRRGEGRERGDDSQYGVPTLSSKLWAHYVEPGYLTRVIATGKAGTIMEGFRKGHYDGKDGSVRNTLSAEELESVTSFVNSGAFAEYGPRFDEIAAASCAVCHTKKRHLHESMTRRGRVSYFKKHPLRYSIERMCEFERIACPPTAEEVTKGRELYDNLCMHCHDSPAKGEPRAREISAPRIDNYFKSAEFSDSVFLMNVICGRGDGAGNKWRHTGILKRELAIEQIVAVVYYLRGGLRE